MLELVVPLYELARIMWNAALFASTDELRPSLCTIRLRVMAVGPTIQVSCLGVDGYRAGQDHLVIDGPPPMHLLAGPADYVLDGCEAMDVAKILRKVERPEDADKDKPLTVRLTCKETDVTFEHGELTMYRIPTVGVLFPQTIEQVFGAHAPSTYSHVSFNPRFLGDYKRVLFADARTIAGVPVEMAFGTGRNGAPVGACLIAMGTTFSGLLMPMVLDKDRVDRVDDDGRETPAAAPQLRRDAATEIRKGKKARKSDEGTRTLRLVTLEGEIIGEHPEDDDEGDDDEGREPASDAEERDALFDEPDDGEGDDDG